MNRESKFKKYFKYDSRKLKKGTKAAKKLDKILLQMFKQIRGIWLSSSVDNKLLKWSQGCHQKIYAYISPVKQLHRELQPNKEFTLS